MSVVFCEGAQSSPDARLFRVLLAGRCEIRAFGGKYGMGSRIHAHREALKAPVVFGVLDGDFREALPASLHDPGQWVGSDDTHFGWRWTRKEIENYLIDPDVVSRSLGARAPDPNEYRIALERARDRIGTYQAARHALSLSRKRFSPLTNEFGRPRGSEKHLFPDAVDLVGCRSGICDTVAQHGANQLVREDEVLQRFNGLQPSFAPGGSHHGAFLWTYAGKDLLYEMRDELQALGYPSPWVFREHVVVGIEQSTEDVGAWIAEWAALRIVVDNA